MKRNKNFQFEQLDILKLFDFYHIEYTEHGKNVGSGWVGLKVCPICGITGNHLGINIQSEYWHCWGCGGKGNPVNLIKEILKININETLEIIKKFYNGALEFNIKETGDKVILPSNVTELCQSGGDYLKSRGFNPIYIRDKYQVQQTGMSSKVSLGEITSDFSYRIIIPIWMNRKLVSYTGRDYTGLREPKYKHSFIEACIIPPSSCIYGIDFVKDKAIIVEGPTDVWRMGDGTISLQGIQWTREQLVYLSEKNLKKAVVLYDSGKEEEATKLANILTGFIPVVQVAYLEEDDPGNLSDIEALKIKYQLIGG